MNSDVEFHIRHNYPWSKLPANIRQVSCFDVHFQSSAGHPCRLSATVSTSYSVSLNSNSNLDLQLSCTLPHLFRLTPTFIALYYPLPTPSCNNHFSCFCFSRVVAGNAPVNWIPGRGGPGWGGDSEPTFCTIFHSPRPPRHIFMSLIPAPRGTFFKMGPKGSHTYQLRRPTHGMETSRSTWTC